jgi:ribosomal protein S12 methylthiotransferase accessory factor
MNFKDIRDAYARGLPEGELQVFRDDALDRLGIPVVAAALRTEGGDWIPAHGYGATEDEGVVSALGELTEEVYADRLMATRPRFHGSYHQMVGERGASGVADPLTLCLPAGSAYHPDLPLVWVETERLSTGETVLVPEEYVTTDPCQLQGRSPLIRPITNGQGAGLTREQAVVHGLLELLQRDGNCVGFRALDRGTVIDLEGADLSPTVRELLERYRAAGIEVLVKLASTDFGLVNVYVVGRDLNVGEQTLMVTACGEAADPDRDRAVRKALLEYAGSRTRKAFQHGPLEHVERVAPPGYLEGFLPQVKRNMGTEENRALHDMVEWLRMPVQTLRAHMGVTLSHQRTVRFEELPQAHVTSDPKARCAEVVRQLTDAGFDILVADLSPEGHAVHTVKVIVPGLEVETMTYYRLGERNVARLLARDERLVGIGRAPAGSLHVRLTPQAEDRLGGHAWFNIEEAERRVGRLYALYREPERHSAQLMLRARRHGGGLS